MAIILGPKIVHKFLFLSTFCFLISQVVLEQLRAETEKEKEKEKETVTESVTQISTKSKKEIVDNMEMCVGNLTVATLLEFDKDLHNWRIKNAARKVIYAFVSQADKVCCLASEHTKPYKKQMTICNPATPEDEQPTDKLEKSLIEVADVGKDKEKELMKKCKKYDSDENRSCLVIKYSWVVIILSILAVFGLVSAIYYLKRK